MKVPALDAAQGEVSIRGERAPGLSRGLTRIGRGETVSFGATFENVESNNRTFSSDGGVKGDMVVDAKVVTTKPDDDGAVRM